MLRLSKRNAVVAIASPSQILPAKQGYCAQINLTLEFISLGVSVGDDFSGARTMRVPRISAQGRAFDR
jgi:hypothetical protein